MLSQILEKLASKLETNCMENTDTGKKSPKLAITPTEATQAGKGPLTKAARPEQLVKAIQDQKAMPD